MFKKSSANLFIRLFGVFKIPLIAFVYPKVLEISSEKVVIRIKKNWRTKNHYNSMYFGALAIGGDLAAGFLAFAKAREQKLNPSFVFKSFSVNFIKRPDSHVYFVCQNGLEIDQMFIDSTERGERVTKDTSVLAYTNYYKPNKELIAEMTLGVSIKIKS